MPLILALLGALLLAGSSGAASPPAAKRKPSGPGKGPLPAGTDVRDTADTVISIADAVGEIALPMVANAVAPGTGVAVTAAIKISKPYLTPTEEAEMLYGGPLGSAAAVGSAIGRGLGGKKWIP